MANGIILIDTSILIDYFRISDKANSKLISLIKTGYKFRVSIAIADLFIAATAICNNLSFATLNRKHFDWIDNLQIIE